MAKSQCSKAFPSNKVDYHCGHTTFEGNRVKYVVMLYITTPFIQSFRADKKEGGKSTQFWLLLEGGKVIRDGLGLYGDKGAFHTLAIVCASQGYSFGLGFGF